MATTLQPIPMGIIISVIFGLALTAADLLVGAGGDDLHRAGGADDGDGADAGGRRGHRGLQLPDGGLRGVQLPENRVAGLVAQGLVTSMLQVGNILSTRRF
jgi:hypothetical protein